MPSTQGLSRTETDIRGRSSAGLGPGPFGGGGSSPFARTKWLVNWGNASPIEAPLAEPCQIDRGRRMGMSVLLTKMHGRIRMNGDYYGREPTNAQYTRIFSNLDGPPRTHACWFRSRSLRGWALESLRPHLARTEINERGSSVQKLPTNSACCSNHGDRAHRRLRRHRNHGFACPSLQGHNAGQGHCRPQWCRLHLGDELLRRRRPSATRHDPWRDRGRHLGPAGHAQARERSQRAQRHILHIGDQLLRRRVQRCRRRRRRPHRGPPLSPPLPTQW